MENNKAFTLIELLIVIAIVGFLAVMALVALRNAQLKAKITTALEFSSGLSRSLGASACGWWEFDGSGNQAQDLSSFGNIGTIYGAIYSVDTPQAFIGQNTGSTALSFDGVDDYVEVAHAPSLEPTSITVEAWVKLNSDGTRHIILAKWFGYTLEVNSGGAPLFQINNSQGQVGVNGATVIKWGEWTHLAGTFSNPSKVIRVYINGKEAGKATLASSIIYSQNVLRISNTLYGGGAVRGLIDGVRIYDTPLAAAEIQKHYAVGLQSRQDLVLNY